MKKDNLKRDISKRLYSVEEASIYLGRSVCAVRELIWAGKLESVQWDRRIYIDKNDMDLLIERHKVRITY